jgi:16S rRNA (guanine966-N2)-methyltransferase
MTDKVRSALFSMLGSLGVEPDRVLDLYAGTGSLGIEALSRGALTAEFVEQNAAACAVIRANLAHTGYQDVTRVHQLPVATYLTRAGRPGPADVPFDLVILDPPYADPTIVATLTAVGASPLVQSGGVVALGHWPRLVPPARAGRLAQLRHRCHGDSCFSIYEVVADALDEATATEPDGPGQDTDGRGDGAAPGDRDRRTGR